MENEQLKTLLATTLESRKYSIRTIQAYTSWLNDLVNYYPVDLLINIDEAGLNEYLEHLKNNRKLSLASIRQAKDALKFTYNSLLKKKFNFNSYTTKWSDRPQIDVPTQEETLLIIDHIAAKDSKLAITLIYAAGLELTEALNIKIKDIDLINRLVKIPVNRNKGVREVIIPNVLLEEIKIQYLSKDKTAFLFSNADGSQYHATRLQKAFLKSKRSLGIKKSYSIKSLRYAYVKHLELLGIPVVNTIQHMKLSKAASLEFYSRIGIGDVQVTFSPLDRKIRKSEEEKHEISPYVSETRIKELSNAKNNKIDLIRLIELLNELNIAHKNMAFMSIAMLIRAILDHVPPIFEFDTFNEVVNNYQSNKSFKKAMTHLNNSLRNVADTYLHLRVRQKESLPTFNQVDFRSDLDLLLAEIERLMR